jgi:hypothetical protein
MQISKADKRRAVADHLAEHGGRALKWMATGNPELFGQLAESIGPNPTDEELDRLADRIVASLRRGTPDEGKPLLRRMH